MRRWAAALAGLALAAPAALAAFPETPPDDPLFDASPLPNATNEQWDLASPAGGYDRGISADRAWAITTGEGAVVADVDVGVQLDHPDLAGRFTDGFDFYARDRDPTSDTQNAHGTNVAGVLGAATGNGIGIAGIAPGARIMPLRTADNILHQGTRLAEAIVYAADHGADVMSMSLGADTFSLSLRRAISYADRKGVLAVVAAGNEFHFHHHWPQLADEALAVGGLNPDSANTTALSDGTALTANRFDIRAQYSDYGPHLDVVAPTQVPTTQWGGGYIKNWSGTSAATPHVAGVATLVYSRARALGLSLSTEEVRQLIRQTADDQADAGQGEREGWDRLTGWGRVNAYEAVRRVRPDTLPPETNITAPGWYRPLRGAARVAATVRARTGPARWELEIGRGEEPSSWRALASGRTRAAGRAGRVRALVRGLTPGGWTLRLRSRDAHGNEGEDRAYFRRLGDRSLERGFPKSLGSSGEASPVLADLTGDGVPELVLATSDGYVRAYRGGRPGRRGPRALRGWPRRMRPAPGYRAMKRAIGASGFAGFVATPAVGDIAGDLRPEVVAAALDGRVYAWHANGRRVRGFPVRIGVSRPPDGKRDAAIYASPALAELSGDRRLDIVVGAADQFVYAWDGGGRSLPGWPVLARDGEAGDVAKILSSPAIGDIDGDGSPDVVEGSGEAYGSTPSTSGRVHAWNARGEPLPGWPVKPPALAADSIPLVGEGVPVSPVLADVDGNGDDEVAVAAFTGQPELYDGDGTRLSGPAGSESRFQVTGRGGLSPSQAPSAIALGANAAFGRTAPGGPIRFFGGLVDSRLALAQASPATPVAFEHLLGGWDARSGEWLPAFPRPVEGWTIVTGPVVADVDGDGSSEVLLGTSGNVLHAYREDGSEPDGWPKPTEGWLLAAPAVGDIDGDGRREVVAVTRDGWLFAWDTPAPADGPADWPSFRHDPQNTGRLR